MSYKDRAHYVAETFIENRPDALLKPIMGKLFGGNAPGYQTDDSLWIPTLARTRTELERAYFAESHRERSTRFSCSRERSLLSVGRLGRM
jgi:hypothetical protein